MKFRIVLIALAGVASLPALATSGFTPVPGEAGVVTHAMPSTKSRADVLKDLAAWKRNPVTADGWREVGGDAGWVFEGVASGKTRAAVIQEMMQARANPVSADGWRDVGGEAGAVFVGVPGAATGSAVANTPRRTHDGQGSTGLSRSGHQSGLGVAPHGHR